MRPPLEPTRATLLSRIRDTADAAAWIEFQDRYRGLLVRFTLSRGMQLADAEDVVQAVFASLARTIPGGGFAYDPAKGRFRDYLFRCTRNAISAHRRPNRAAAPLDLYDGQGHDGAAPDGHDPAESALWEKEWVAHHYRQAMTTLRSTFDAQSIEVFEHALA
ncbi:MAG TPA: sigma factor, partial [Phycisphaerales bacterium]|nr:sigma factor [Phycisphaerales bacterium]